MFAVPVTVPTVAVIVADPIVDAVTSPWLPVVLLTLATAELDELHVAEVVKSSKSPLFIVAVTLSCCVEPFATNAVSGATANDTGAGVVTVRVVELLIVPTVAVIVVVPALSP